MNLPLLAHPPRLGVLGCGRISHKHFDAIEALGDRIQCVAVCDTNPDKRAQAAQRLGAKAYEHLEDMLAADIDVVTIATPNGMHPEHIQQIADRGKHVICEKPLAVDFQAGRQAYQRCQQRGVGFFLVHQNRFNPAIQQLWRAVEAGRFGPIYMISSQVFWTRPQSYYDTEATWHGTAALDGGTFLTQASHAIDLMQWLARSEPKMVQAQFRTLARNIETEDSGMAHIEWHNGILGSINVTMLTYPRNLEASVTVLGERGTVRIGGIAMNRIEHWCFEDERPDDPMVDQAQDNNDSVYGQGHIPYYQHVVDCLRGKETPLVDGEEALKSLQLMTAMKHASQTGQAVLFDHMPDFQR